MQDLKFMFSSRARVLLWLKSLGRIYGRLKHCAPLHVCRLSCLHMHVCTYACVMLCLIPWIGEIYLMERILCSRNCRQFKERKSLIQPLLASGFAKLQVLYYTISVKQITIFRHEGMNPTLLHD